MNKEGKAKLKYHMREWLFSAVSASIIFIVLLLNEYSKTWLWHIEQCVFLLVLYSLNRIYTREKNNVNEIIDVIPKRCHNCGYVIRKIRS